MPLTPLTPTALSLTAQTPNALTVTPVNPTDGVALFPPFFPGESVFPSAGDLRLTPVTPTSL